MNIKISRRAICHWKEREREREKEREREAMGLQMAGKRVRAQILVSAAHSGESKLFRYKNVWEVIHSLFLATIVNAFFIDIKTNLGLNIWTVLRQLV